MVIPDIMGNLALIGMAKPNGLQSRSLNHHPRHGRKRLRDLRPPALPLGEVAIVQPLAHKAGRERKVAHPPMVSTLVLPKTFAACQAGLKLSSLPVGAYLWPSQSVYLYDTKFSMAVCWAARRSRLMASRATRQGTVRAQRLDLTQAGAEEADTKPMVLREGRR